MKRILLILFMAICLPVQAEQFKQFGNEIVNKKAVTHVKIYNSSITIFYMAGAGDLYNPAEFIKTDINCPDKQVKLKKFNEIKQWLNSKD